MICFNCGLKLHTGEEKECRLCGVKFSVRCPQCGSPNPGAAKFCVSCGTKLIGTEAQSSVQNFDTLSESRRNVAVLFADVSGFTSLSEKLDPEEVREIINGCFNYITLPVYELEGTIDKYIGDCVMVLFGAKYTHSDDARRAVICAMKMMSLIREFSESMLSSRGLKLNLSIGVNYGLVVTGGVGNYFDRDYTVMGDIVNTAQRLQSSSEGGTILVSESVYAETKDTVEYSEMKEVRVKNKENPVKCYAPVSIRKDFSIERESLFIEREKEIASLNAVYNNVLNAGLQCVTVTGEAGIGKTTLLKEFASKLGNEAKKIWLDCSHVYQSRTNHLISSLLMNIMNINSGDSGTMKQHRLISFLDYILYSYSDEEIKRCYDFLGLLMGLDKDNEFRSVFESMSFESIHREILKQLSLFFTNLSLKNKLVVIVDDAHWSDSSSLQLLRELVDGLANVKVAFILSSRYEIPELKVGNKKGIFQSIRLSALSKGGVDSLACRLLGCSRIDEKLLDSILGFSNGNPIYIREFISSMIKAGGYSMQGQEDAAFTDTGKTVSLPGSIQSLILSKISSLEERTRNILQSASVIGKDFSFSLLNHLLENSLDEKEILGAPAQLNIVELKSVHTSARMVEKNFTFCHELEREVIYDSILNRNKKELHKKIGEYIETRYLKEIEGYYELLAMHFLKAGLSKKAAEYYHKTAEKHKNNFDFRTSLDYYNKFLELAEKEEDAESIRKTVQVHRDMGYIYTVIADYDTAQSYIDKALEKTQSQSETYALKVMKAEVYKDQGLFTDAVGLIDEIEPHVKQDKNVFGKLLQIKCDLLRKEGNAKALSIAKKSEKILLKARDYQNLSETMKHAGMIYFIKGDIDNALFFMNKSFKYSEKINSLETMARVSGDLGIIYHSTGMVSKALEFFNKSMEISKKISYLRGYIAACINLGVLYLDKGLFGKAEVLCTESLKNSREILLRLYECASLTNLGDISYELGHFEKAFAHYSESLEVSRQINAPIEEAINYIGLVKLKIKAGAYEGVPEMLEAALAIFTEADELAYICDYHIHRGQYELLCCRSMEAAFEHYSKAVEASISCKDTRRKVRALRCKGGLSIQMNDLDHALQTLHESVEIAGQLESDYEAAKSCFVLSKALELSGRYDEARIFHGKAEDYIHRIDPCRWTEIIENGMPIQK